MSQQPSSSTSSSVEGQSVVAQGRQYDPGLLSVLGIWYIISFLMMFSGGLQGLIDTIGLFSILVETLILLALDKPGLISMRGLVNRESLSNGQRILLNIGEVIFFVLMTGVYLVRTITEYQKMMSAEAPKTPGEQGGAKK